MLLFGDVAADSSIDMDSGIDSGFNFADAGLLLFGDHLGFLDS